MDENQFYSEDCSTFSFQAFENMVDTGKLPKFIRSAAISRYELSEESNEIPENFQDEILLKESASTDGGDAQEIAEAMEDLEIKPTSTSMKAFSHQSIASQSHTINIDINPKLYFGRGPVVELLISSGVGRCFLIGL